MGDVVLAGIRIWLRIILPGLAWLWIIPQNISRPPHAWQRLLHAGATALMLGVLCTGFATLMLGEVGAYSQRTDLLVYIATIGTGLILGGWFCGKNLWQRIRDALPLHVLLLAGIMVILALPHRGEWIAGGWDPGVYAGQAAALSHAGTFYPDDSFFHELFAEEEQQPFTRTLGGRTERFPGVTVQPDKHSFTFEFFKFTPAVFAAIHRAGGMQAMLRSNTIIALLIAPCFFVLIWQAAGLATAAFATLILVTQPIFLYHTHWPLTEPLQLFLICGLLYMTMLARRFGTALLAALFIMAAILNRFSFLPFFGIYIMCLSLGEALQDKRRQVIGRHLLFIAAASSAAFINYRIAPTSLWGWVDTPLILFFTIGAASSAIILDCIFSRQSIRMRINRLTPIQIDFAAGAFLVLLATTWILRGYIGRAADSTNLQRLIPFTGTLAMLLAATGGIVLFFRRPRIKADVFFPLCLYLLLAAWLMILRKSIMDWFPWATRRYYQTLVPWIALTAGYLLATLSTIKLKRWHWAGKALSGALLLLLLAEIAPTSWRAWRYTSYNGLHQQIADIAAQFDEKDIIITDHPLWGTPLALIHGVKVLNGLAAWEDTSGKTMAAIAPMLERLETNGWRVFFLTNTPAGVDIYPLDSNHFELTHQFPPYEYQRIIQHRRANQYALTTATTHFRIYRFVP